MVEISIIFAFIGSFIFGFTAVILQIGVKDQNIFSGMVIRAIGSLPILIILNIWLYGTNFFDIYLQTELLLYVISASFCLVLGDLLLMFALKRKPVGVIVPIIAINPLFTTLLLLFTNQAPVTGTIIILVVFIIFGIFLVTFNKSDNEKSILELIDFEVIFFGIFIAILWGIMQFLEIIILKTDGITGISYVSIKFTIVGSASLVGYIVILIKNKLNESSVKIKFTNKRSFKYLIFAGFIAWTVGSVLVYTAFEIGRPEILTPIIGINPIFAVLVSLSLGYEKMNATKGIGITLCVLCSLLLVL